LKAHDIEHRFDQLTVGVSFKQMRCNFFIRYGAWALTSLYNKTFVLMEHCNGKAHPGRCPY